MLELTAIRSPWPEDKMDALTLMQIHRNDIPPPDAVTDCSAATTARRIYFVLSKHLGHSTGVMLLPRIFTYFQMFICR
jgi:hypothetical protein